MHKAKSEEVFLKSWTEDMFPSKSDADIKEIIQRGKELAPEDFTIAEPEYPPLVAPKFTGNDIELQVELEKLIKNNPLAQVGLRNMMRGTGGDLSKVIKNIQSFNYNKTGDKAPIALFKNKDGTTRYGGLVRGATSTDIGSSGGELSAERNAYLFYNATDMLDPKSDIGGALGDLLKKLKNNNEPYPNINNLYKIDKNGKKEFQTGYYNSLSMDQKKAIQLQADARSSSLDTLIHELMHHGTNVLVDSGNLGTDAKKTLKRLRNEDFAYGFDPETSNEHTLISEILSGTGKIPPIDELMQLSSETNPALIGFDDRKPVYKVTDPASEDNYEDQVARSLVDPKVIPSYIRATIQTPDPRYLTKKNNIETADPSATIPMYNDLKMINDAALAWLSKNSPPEAIQSFIRRKNDVNPRMGYESGDDDLRKFTSEQENVPTSYKEEYAGPDSFRDRTDETETYTGPVPELMAEGGPVMALEEQTEMAFGTEVDPVSGNKVPPGALPSEVRDDIPARLSAGEYVVPADVLQFYGIKFFEDLRTQAKTELAGLERNGRMGGEPIEGQEELPFSLDELETFDDGQPVAANKGGMIRGYEPGGLVTEMYTGSAPVVKTYVNDAGLKMYIRFINGIAVPPVPPGYVEEGAAVTPVETVDPTPVQSNDGELDDSGPPVRPTLADIVNDSMNPPFKLPGFGTLGVAAKLVDKFFPTNSTAQIMAYVNEYGTLPPSGGGQKALPGEEEIGDGFRVHPIGHPLEGTIVRDLTAEDEITPGILNTFKTVIYPAFLANTKDGKFNKKGYSKDIAGSFNEDGTIADTIRTDIKKGSSQESSTSMGADTIRAKALIDAKNLVRRAEIDEEIDAFKDSDLSVLEQLKANRENLTGREKAKDRVNQQRKDEGKLSLSEMVDERNFYRPMDVASPKDFTTRPDEPLETQIASRETSAGAYSGKSGGRNEYGMNKGGLASRRKGKNK